MVERNEPVTPERPETDPTPELVRLVELSSKYPEIGPPLAELAYKIGQGELGDRIVRMGLERGTPGLEYYFVAVSAARREGRYADALARTIDAVRAYAAAPDESLVPDDGARLLHLVRTGFATLMFDRKDVRAEPAFVAALAEELPKLEGRLGGDPFFRSLMAQTLWYADRERSEKEWERAAEQGEPELTWNARGTWYKEAEQDPAKAERAYRQGLEKAPRSALLRHNLAQLLLEKAAGPDVDVAGTHRLLREADEHLRAALREEAPKGLRRHVHSTRDRLATLRASLPRPGAAPERPVERPVEPERMPEAGEVVRGRVLSLTAFGAFVSLGGQNVGLLHKSEMAHEPVNDPARLVKVGDEVEVKIIDVRREAGGKLRIALSRKALLPAPPAAEVAERPRPDRRKGERKPDPRPPGRPDRRGEERGRREAADPQIQRIVDGKLASLGEMILAKLREQGGK